MKVSSNITGGVVFEESALKELSQNAENEGSQFIIKFYGSKAMLAGKAFILEYAPYSLITMLKDPSKIKNSTQKVYITLCLLKGVAFAHSVNVFHRDLKPENVLMSEQMVPKIIGWNFSKCGYNCGTSGYMAPELYGPEKISRDLDKCDSWSMGCILYELYNDGVKLFNSKEDVDTFVESRDEPTIQHRPSVSADAVDLISKLLQRDPSKRSSIRSLMDHPLIKAFNHTTKSKLVRDI